MYIWRTDAWRLTENENFSKNFSQRAQSLEDHKEKSNVFVCYLIANLMYNLRTKTTSFPFCDLCPLVFFV